MNLDGPGPGSGASAPDGRIARKEFRFVLAVAFALCLATSVPYVLGYETASAGTTFTGVLAFNGDQNNYLAYARQAAAGQWLFHNPMTAERHADVFFNLEWLAIGKMASALGVSLESAMNIQRLLAIALMCFSAYWLSALCLRGLAARRAALVAVMAGGGFGWLVVLPRYRISVDPRLFVDSWAGLFPYFWALKVPHFLVAQLFVVTGLCFVLRREQSGRLQDAVLAGLSFVAAGCSRTYDMLYVMLAVGLFVVRKAVEEGRVGRKALLRAIPIAMCVPPLAYYFWLFKVHPVFRWWSQPGGGPPRPLVLWASFGLAGVLLLPALWKLRGRPAENSSNLLVCCLLAAGALTYSDLLFAYSFQWATDIAVPLTVLVVMGMAEWYGELPARGRGVGLVVWVLLVLNGLTAVGLTAAASTRVVAGDFRRDVALVAAIRWIGDHSSPGDVVLASYDNANLVPQYTHNHALCGYYNAVDYFGKRAEIERFLDPTSPEEFRAGVIRRYDVQYVLLSRAERDRIESQGRIPLVRKVFENSAAAVYSRGGRSDG